MGCSGRCNRRPRRCSTKRRSKSLRGSRALGRRSARGRRRLVEKDLPSSSHSARQRRSSRDLALPEPLPSRRNVAADALDPSISRRKACPRVRLGPVRRVRAEAISLSRPAWAAPPRPPRRAWAIRHPRRDGCDGPALPAPHRSAGKFGLAPHANALAVRGRRELHPALSVAHFVPGRMGGTRKAERQLIEHVNRVTNAGMEVRDLTIGFARRDATHKRGDLVSPTGID
jgi:hypothetical protein